MALDYRVQFALLRTSVCGGLPLARVVAGSVRLLRVWTIRWGVRDAGGSGSIGSIGSCQLPC